MSEDGSHIKRRFYCTEAVIPIRSSPSESSEMTSQLIFGDIAHYIEKKDSWTLVRCDFDSYKGWVDSKMLTEIDSNLDFSLFYWKWVKEARLEFPSSTYPQVLPLGARLPFLSDQTHDIWDPRSSNPQLVRGSTFFGEEELADTRRLAKAFHYSPYLWGGCSSFGIDCSGLTQRVFRMSGKHIPRDSGPQESKGMLIDWGKRKAGDLAFFAKPNQSKITHVGIVVDKETIIHASGHVRIDELTSIGIIHSDKQTLTHELISIKR